MYFVTGGSFNGKSRWVKIHFNLKETDTTWIPLFNGKRIQLDEINFSNSVIVMEGFEYGIRSTILNNDSEIRKSFTILIQSLKQWEEEDSDRSVIWIGSEIGKGIVPMDKLSREWRDMTGWIYQDLAEMSQEVWVVWYGLATSLKG
ncbi:bifunctional adenosylcobinamide kinase/adenosylcobinamide-phosphate guanylyltransferase [Rossellomorea aquimaris]|uniref:Adenosylcobinamide kinase n=1 Tax=Rossellomorea aquimaris TaxID=189382 RepID=A0A366F0C7_9BACI|nr:bifunctional adenosylcobinamide kinase/adenosylcobinamide-phosphate guanylyltransferase [Rossellomorea aquimaris]RBP08101.1 adenosylcobinamide kinase /adenosylcobinamide-phosphate guanylyltransferase [Rossellomorea aquimaris]